MGILPLSLIFSFEKKENKREKEEGNLGVIDGLFFSQIYWENGMGERRERRGLANLKICY